MSHLRFWIRGDWGWLKFWSQENRRRPFFVIVGGQYLDRRNVLHIKQWIGGWL